MQKLYMARYQPFLVAAFTIVTTFFFTMGWEFFLEDIFWWVKGNEVEHEALSHRLEFVGTATVLVAFAVAVPALFLRRSIQQREQARKAHRRSEQRFKSFADLSSDWLWETDEKLRYTWFSENVDPVTGLPREWHYGKTQDDQGAPNIDPESWKQHLETLRRREPFRDFVLRRMGDDGETWIRSSGSPFYDQQGNFKGYRCAGTDITAQVFAEQRAERDHAQLIGAIEGLSAIFVLWDAEDRLVICNKQFREINSAVIETTQPGTPFDVHIRAGLATGLYPDAVGREEEWFEERLARHRNPDKPFELERGGGRWILIREERTANGDIVTMSTDITDRKRAEEALRRANIGLEQHVTERTVDLERVNSALRVGEKRFQDFAEASSDWLWETDADLKFTYFSANVRRILGVEPEWHYGKTREDLLGDEYDALEWDSHFQTLKTRQPFRDFTFLRQGDGIEPRWLSTSGVPIFADDGTFAGYRGTGSDVNARVMAEMGIHDREAQLRLIIDSLPMLIAYFDNDEICQVANKTCQEWFGRGADGIVGSSLETILPGRYEILTPRIQTVLSGVPISSVEPVLCGDGERRELRMNFVPRFDGGQVVGCCVLAEEVGERRSAEQVVGVEAERRNASMNV